MEIVPEGKVIYIGARKFVEGDIIPPGLFQGIEIIHNKRNFVDENMIPEKPKRQYRSKKGAVIL